MGRQEPKRGVETMSPDALESARQAIEGARAAAVPPQGEISMFDSLPFDLAESAPVDEVYTDDLELEPGPVPESEPATAPDPDLFGAVDQEAAPLPRRALRTDDKAWPGREKFEANKPGASATKRGAGADAKLAGTLAPQMGLGFEVETVQAGPPKLVDKFVVPTFTVLDTKADYWRSRRTAWKTLGMRAETISPDFDKPEEGNLKDGSVGLNGEEQKRAAYNQASLDVDRETSAPTGTSIFDPVLCEVAYRWFSGPGAVVLDPFAGGAVRGVMAGVLGRAYTGIELRPEQVQDNRTQSENLIQQLDAGHFDLGRAYVPPTWIEGDATQLRNIDEAPDQADLVFTCPPYADLEIYSTDPRDLSTSSYATFRALLAQALAAAAERLRNDRFAVVVLGEARNVKTGMPYDLITDAKVMARECGLPLYNEIILLNAIGSAAVRAAGSMRTRKITRVHQHVLVFVKGNPKAAAAACGSAELDA